MVPSMPEVMQGTDMAAPMMGNNNNGNNDGAENKNELKDLLLIMNAKMTEMGDAVKGIHNRMDVFEQRSVMLENENKVLTTKLTATQERLAFVEERVEYLDNQARKCNVVIGGLVGPQEETWETVEDTVVNFIKNTLKVDTNRISVEKAIRLKKSKSAVKPMLVTFTSEKQKRLILDAGNKSLTAGGRTWMKADFSPGWRATRKILARFYDEVKKAGHEVKVVNDFMLIDGKKYRYDAGIDKVVANDT